LNSLQGPAGMVRCEFIWRVEVDEGSKPALEGVRRALRFWVMESSIALRERRRKSGLGIS